MRLAARGVEVVRVALAAIRAELAIAGQARQPAEAQALATGSSSRSSGARHRLEHAFASFGLRDGYRVLAVETCTAE